MNNRQLTPEEKKLAYKGNFIIRINLLTDPKYTPYCGNYIPGAISSCSLPRTVFNGEQFVCPECGYTTEFPEDFISYYKQKWGK